MADDWAHLPLHERRTQIGRLVYHVVVNSGQRGGNMADRITRMYGRVRIDWRPEWEAAYRSASIVDPEAQDYLAELARKGLFDDRLA